MDKLININDNKKIFVSYDDKSYCSQINVREAILKEGKIDKIINFNMSDDFSFEACSNQGPEFTFDIEDPLYFALNRLLGNDSSLVIEDDNTDGYGIKYMEIKRNNSNNSNINIIFNSDNNNYNVFIKNIGPDGRSKIIDFNTKYKLCTLFKEFVDILLNDNYQYGLDEYYEILKSRGYYKEPNPFFIEHKIIRNPGECCANCEYSNSPELIDQILKENSEYIDITFEEAEKIIGNCELGVDNYTSGKNNFWCEKYLMNEEYKSLIKKY